MPRDLIDDDRATQVNAAMSPVRCHAASVGEASV